MLPDAPGLSDFVTGLALEIDFYLSGSQRSLILCQLLNDARRSAG
jgi:hypothetical protein